MKVLIADDDRSCRALLANALRKMNHEVQICRDGREALYALTGPHAPRIAILDWMMPEFSGPEVCRRVRESISRLECFIMIVTKKDSPNDIALGLKSGANDFLTKPFHLAELEARVTNGCSLVEAHQQLKVFAGLLPICAWCKMIRDGEGRWHRFEDYIESNSHARFTHGGCPSCAEALIDDYKLGIENIKK